MESNTPHAKYCILNKIEEHWQLEQISIAYDWQKAVDAALCNSRPDWTKWLSTGLA